MVSILDLLKAKGIDPSQLSSSLPPQQDSISNLQAATQSTQQVQDQSNGPSESAQRGLAAILQAGKSNQQTNPSQDLKLPPDSPTTGPAKTDTVPQTPTNQDGVFAGFSQPDSPKKPDDNDSNGESSPEHSLSQSKSPDSSQKQAMQSVLNQGGFTDNTVEGLKAVQDQSRKDQALDGVMRAVNQISSGIYGMGHTGAKPADLSDSNKFYDQQDALAKQGVTDFSSRGEQEKNDPNSAISAQARSFAGPLLAKLGMKMPENVSYSALEKLNPQLTKMADLQESQKARHEDLALKYAMLNQNKQDKATAKSSSDQDKALLSTNQLLESARGNPAAAQAEKDIYSADKAKSLANLYGDPNKLNPAMVQLLSSEVAKIAAGGAPTMHELEGLTPQTIRSRLASQTEKLTNNPSPANAAAFVKQYQDYADALTNDAKKVIQDKYGRVIESRKKQLGSDNYDTLKQQYINRFGTTPTGNVAAPQSGSPAQATSGKVTVSNGKESFEIDPSDLAHAQADGYQVIK